VGRGIAAFDLFVSENNGASRAHYRDAIEGPGLGQPGVRYVLHLPSMPRAIASRRPARLTP
jgi:hypothetical protein